jgi:hypothetical protein
MAQGDRRNDRGVPYNEGMSPNQLGRLRQRAIALAIILLTLTAYGCSIKVAIEPIGDTSTEDTTARLMSHATTAAQIYVENNLDVHSHNNGSPCELVSLKGPDIRNGDTIDYSFEIYCGPAKKWSSSKVKLTCTYLIGEQYAFLAGSRDWQSDSWITTPYQYQMELANGQLINWQPCPASE